MRGKIAALVAAVTAAAGTAGAAVWARGRKQDGDLDLEVAEPRDATVAPKAAAPVEPSPPGDARVARDAEAMHTALVGGDDVAADRIAQVGTYPFGYLGGIAKSRHRKGIQVQLQ